MGRETLKWCNDMVLAGVCAWAAAAAALKVGLLLTSNHWIDSFIVQSNSGVMTSCKETFTINQFTRGEEGAT
eukprot:366278-Chlamydomonas_euryale.AAC.45